MAVLQATRAANGLTGLGVIFLALVATAQPPVITRQPVSQTTLDCRSVTFSVEATGANLHFQWFREVMAIAGATNSAHTVTRATVRDNGSIFAVEVSNEYGSVTSSNAVLFVSQDPNVVFVRRALASDDGLAIFVEFSTEVTNANNVENYLIMGGTNGTLLEVESATYSSGGQIGERVVLRLKSETPMVADGNYSLRAENISDECGNMIFSTTATPILAPVRLTVMTYGVGMGRLTWTGIGALQVATNLTNPTWRTITNAISPYGPFSLTGNAFFRVW